MHTLSIVAEGVHFYEIDYAIGFPIPLDASVLATIHP